MIAADNLRGRDVIVWLDDRACLATVITHIRGEIWMVEGRELPRRFQRPYGVRRTTVTRDLMTLVAETRRGEGEVRRGTEQENEGSI